MASTRTLLILVTSVAVAWTRPQQSKDGGDAGAGCNPIRTDRPISTANATAGCKPDPSGAYYEGDCWALLLKQGPCPAMHWLVLDMDTGRFVCKLEVCIHGHYVCERRGIASSSKHCAPTQELIFTESGEPECECPSEMAYYYPDDRCYRPHEQGPCQQGHTLQVVFRGDQAAAECVASVCPSGEVAMTVECEEVTAATRDDECRCYRLFSRGPCKKGYVLALNPLLNRVTCMWNQVPNAILGPDFPPCIPGSKRDNRGACHKIVTIRNRAVMKRKLAME